LEQKTKESTMNPYKKRILIALSLCAFLVAPMQVKAQESTIHHVYMNRASARAFVANLERHSNSFRAEFEQRYKHWFVSDFRRTDEAKRAIQNLDKAMERLRYKATNQNPRYARDEAALVLQRAKIVDDIADYPDQILSTMKDDWRDLRNDINELADFYELPRL
jgi:hypothetical protein